MFYLRLCILLVFAANLLIAADKNYGKVKEFTNMVLRNITLCEKYVLPQDNSKLYFQLPPQDEKIHDFGKFDFIIIGAGSAGTLLANRLVEIKEWKILLLEAGGEENEFSDIPGMAINLALSEMSWGYKTVAQRRTCRAMDQTKCSSPRGKVLGGSSTIGANIYARGNRQDFDDWAKLVGDTKWQYEDALFYFNKTENTNLKNLDPGYNGKRGLLKVDYVKKTLFTSKFINAKKELGQKELDYNGKKQIGVSRIQFNVKNNKGLSGGRAFIDPIRNKKNLNVTLDAFVTKIIIDKNEKAAIGVEFIRNHKKYKARVSHEVILSAGAVNTPQLLMISGIGLKQELEKVGIKPLVELPVGRSMEDHVVFTGLNIRTNETLFNKSMETLIGDYLNGKRPFTAGFSADAVSFLNVNDKTSKVPNIQQILIVPRGFGPLGWKTLNLRERLLKQSRWLSRPSNDIQILIILLRPKSRGRVTLRSRCAREFPNIHTNHYEEKEDVNTMLKAIKETLKILDTKPFKSMDAKYVPVMEICRQFPEGTDTYWRCMLQQLSTTFYHFVGTTKMGKSSGDGSVVSSKLKVHNVKNLRVVDAGIMPKIPSANPNAATYMVAERAAHIIKIDYKKKYNKYSR